MKRRYQKPEVRKVKLVPAEAVLTGCKTQMNDRQRGSRCYPQCKNSAQGS